MKTTIKNNNNKEEKQKHESLFGDKSFFFSVNKLGNSLEKNKKQCNNRCSQPTFAETLSNPIYAFLYEQIDEIIFSPRPIFDSKENTVESSKDVYDQSKRRKMLVETFSDNLNDILEENGDRIRAMNHNALENRASTSNMKGSSITRKNAVLHIPCIKI